MLTGFKNFVGSAWSGIANFFSKLTNWFSGIISGTRSAVKDNGIYWTFPDYAVIAQQLLTVTEATNVGDKGKLVAKQINQQGLTGRELSASQATEIDNNISNVAMWLGYAFETGVVLSLVTNKRLKLIGNVSKQQLLTKHQDFINKVKNNWQLSTSSKVARDKFIGLLQHYIDVMTNTVYDKSQAILNNCEGQGSINYIGMEQFAGHQVVRGNVAGADFVVSCEGSDQSSYWATKYMSSPHSSIAKTSPADLHRLFGGKGNRSDAYYYRITQSLPEDVRANAVLYDLWDSLKNGWAVDRSVPGKGATLRLKVDWVARMFQEMLLGDVAAKPAFVNYARGTQAVGEFAPAFQRDFDVNNGVFKPKAGAYAEARLEGGYRTESAKPDIKIKVISPGQHGMRRTYLRIYVNDMPTDEHDRFAKYSVQIQMNNLTTQ